MFTPQTVTLCRVTRSKIGNPLVNHHGARIVAVDGRRPSWTDFRDGTVIIDPILDFNADSSFLVKSPEAFACGNDVIADQYTTLTYSEFLQRYSRVAQGLQPYDLIENNCEIVTDVLVEGEPQNRQIKGWGVVAVCVLVVGFMAMINKPSALSSVARA